MKPHIIALAGLAGAGKTEASHRLQERWGYRPVKMAGALKEMIRSLLLYQGMSEGDIARCLEGAFKTTPRAELNGHTPRHAMQTLGTEWGRDLMHPDMWVDIAYRKIQQTLNEGFSVVVDDVRFPNEMTMLNRAGATSVWINRGSGPTTDGHASENSLGPDLTTNIINNTGSLSTYFDRLDDFVVSLYREST